MEEAGFKVADLDDVIQLTGNDASRMAESAAINKSLSVLGQVVHALNQGAVSGQCISTCGL